MRRPLLLALLLLGAASGARAGVWLKEWAAFDESRTPGKDYYATSTEVGTPFGKGGVYGISARLKTFRNRQFMGASQVEYSAALERQLFHVAVKGRLGTQPPNAERAAYHLAQGEAWLTFYGDTVGPRDPNLSPIVWESTTPAPAPASFDTTWVTEFHTIYTNTNHHIQFPNQLFIIVENSWQFELRETWNKRTSVAAQMGFDRYNKVIPVGFAKFFLNNIEYPGNMFAISGWPNNHAAIEAWQRLGGVKIWAAATRLNVLDNNLNLLYGAGVDWERGEHWTLSVGVHHNRRRNSSSKRGISLSAAYRW